MAAEKRILIYYDELIMALAKTYGATMDTRIYSPRDIMSSIQGLRPADAVEVVRCKSCLYYHGVTGKDSGKPCGYGWCEHRNGTKRVCYDEEFCSHGERSKEHGDP